MFIAMDRLAHKQAKLEKKLSLQVDLLRQAKNHHEEVKKDIDNVGASIAKIQTDIRFLEDQRHDLLATRHPNKGGPDAKQAGAEAPPPHSSPPLTEGPINLSRPTEHQGIKTKERASLSPKPGSGPSTRPPEDIAEGPQVQGPRTSKGTNLTAKQARMVETSVWTGRDPAQTTHPPSHASSVSSDGEHEAQAVGVPGRKGVLPFKPQTKPGPYHRQ
jgi:hypothetical protein